MTPSQQSWWATARGAAAGSTGVRHPAACRPPGSRVSVRFSNAVRGSAHDRGGHLSRHVREARDGVGVPRRNLSSPSTTSVSFDIARRLFLDLALRIVSAKRLRSVVVASSPKRSPNSSTSNRSYQRSRVAMPVKSCRARRYERTAAATMLISAPWRCRDGARRSRNWLPDARGPTRTDPGASRRSRSG